ncbi:TetR/AcrR family transcriptional regulator [bacterium]|nr:TetR/AcrR family transcriptional regulator [bacterium]
MKPQKRKQILDIAEKLFNRFGIKRTGVDEIAQLSNVAKGTIYNYFGSKDGIFKELMNDKLQMFEDFLGKTIVSINDPVGKLRIALLSHLKIVIENPFLSDKMLYGNYDEKIRLFLEKLDESSRKIISRIIQNNYTKKLLPKEQQAIVNTLLFTLKGMKETIRGQLESISIKKFEQDIEYLINALLPQKISNQNGS